MKTIGILGIFMHLPHSNCRLTCVGRNIDPSRCSWEFLFSMVN